MINYFMSIASVFGFFTVILGAFGAHGFKNILESNQTVGIYNKAVLYQIFHTMALLFIALIQTEHKLITIAVLSFSFGILIFSGSLYILSLTNLKWLGAITPIGGLMFLFGWFSLFLYSIK